ncbi:MAG TPA: hypothetical protein DCR97_01255 [Deltaproteobacteria bacterium]|nr:hypothetical protein [Deltaproteobacteria bacterium]
MNPIQISILIGALVLSGLILWHDLPIDFPWIIYKVVMLFLKLAAVWAVAIVACIFAAPKKGTGQSD